MSLRALGSLLTRRFSPRAQAQPLGTRESAAGRLARFLHSRRILAAGGAAVAAAATSGGFAYLHLKKATDESAGKAIGEKARKEVNSNKPENAKTVIIISDEACDDGKAGHEVTAGSEPLKERRDMEAEFEDWMKKYDKRYRDDNEKAMQFQLFKEDYVVTVLHMVPLNIQFRRSLLGERWNFWLHLVRRLMERDEAALQALGSINNPNEIS